LAFSGPSIDRLHLADRIRRLHAVWNLAAHDYQVLVDDRRRTLRHVREVGHALQAVGQRDLAVVTEAWNRDAGLRVELEQPSAAVEQNAQLVAVAPERRAAQ